MVILSFGTYLFFKVRDLLASRQKEDHQPQTHSSHSKDYKGCSLREENILVIMGSVCLGMLFGELRFSDAFVFVVNRVVVRFNLFIHGKAMVGVLRDAADPFWNCLRDKTRTLLEDRRIYDGKDVQNEKSVMVVFDERSF